MRYRDLVAHFQRIEATTKRLEMTQHLIALLKELPAGQVDAVVYMMQGALRPDFEGVELGMAEKSVLKALAEVTGLRDDVLVKMKNEEGDVGLAAAKALRSKKQRSLGAEALTLRGVYDQLMSIARSSGTGSQEQKRHLFSELLTNATPEEAVYLVRTVTGRLRLGVADMTLLDALASFDAGTAVSLATLEPEDRAKREELRRLVERAYNVSSDLGLVAKSFLEGGAKGLARIRMRVGTPIRPMLAERARSADEILERMPSGAAMEYKYDGLRMQAHLSKKGVQLFSRRLENITAQFPDVVEAVGAAFRGDSAIVEGEAVAVHRETGEIRPFQEISRRRGRKYGLDASQAKVDGGGERSADFAMGEYPVALFLFDVLLLDGDDMTGLAYEKRRRALEKAFKQTPGVKLAEMRVARTGKEIERFFEEVVSVGAEGIVAKTLDGVYKAGAREWQWAKYKRDYQANLADTLDLVLIGAFWGQGRRAGWYGALLMATHNDEDGTWESVTKLGTGFTDEVLSEMVHKFRRWESKEKPRKVVSELVPDVWFVPAVVMEVVGAELTLSPLHRAAWGALRPDAGLAVRFPRFTGRWREDKKPGDATSSKDLVKLYKKQLKRVQSPPEGA